jgi:hypothetical protein
MPINEEGHLYSRVYPLLVEKLAEQFHSVYMVEVRRQDAPFCHPDAYSELDEGVKDFDRALALFVLENLVDTKQRVRIERMLRVLGGGS